jgi:hypothetical protein
MTHIKTIQQQLAVLQQRERIEMITVTELRTLAETKALDIGKAWEALDQAADRLEYIERHLTATAERMRLESYVHERTDPRHAATLAAFATDVMTGIYVASAKGGGE